MLIYARDCIIPPVMYSVFTWRVNHPLSRIHPSTNLPRFLLEFHSFRLVVTLKEDHRRRDVRVCRIQSSISSRDPIQFEFILLVPFVYNFDRYKLRVSKFLIQRKDKLAREVSLAWCDRKFRIWILPPTTSIPSTRVRRIQTCLSIRYQFRTYI